VRRNGIKLKEVRGLLKLVGELRELARDQRAMVRHALERMARLVGADGAAAGTFSDFRPGGAAVLGSEYLVGFTRKAEQRILVSPLKETGAHDPAIAVDMHRAVSRRIFTHLRRDNVSDAAWNGSAYGADAWRVLRVRDVVCSVVPRRAPAEVFAFALYRTGAASPYVAADRDLVQLFSEAVQPIIAAPAPTPPLKLRPSHRATLRGLLMGLSEKELAYRLELSPHTVHEYVRALYARFGAASRAELLARFIPSEMLPE
jgi:DNA-binding NarL/FixJ family response regulator